MKNLAEKRVEYANHVAGGIVVDPFVCIEFTLNRKKDRHLVPQVIFITSANIFLQSCNKHTRSPICNEEITSREVLSFLGFESNKTRL